MACILGLCIMYRWKVNSDVCCLTLQLSIDFPVKIHFYQIHFAFPFIPLHVSINSLSYRIPLWIAIIYTLLVSTVCSLLLIPYANGDYLFFQLCEQFQ